MNPLGAPAHLFRGPPAAVALAFRQHGLTCVQLTPDFPSLRFRDPADFTPERCRQAARPFQSNGIAIAAVSAGGNLLDPDLDRRHRGIVRLHALLRHAHDFGTACVVTQTGSVSCGSPWEPHPPNRAPEAWAELRLIVATALEVAATHGVSLLLVPEPAHVLASVEEILRLREELASAWLGFVLDPADHLNGHDPASWPTRLADLFTRVGPLAPLVHLKDVRVATGHTSTPRIGRGMLDYGLIGQLLCRWLPDAPLILEHLRPEEVAATRQFLEERLRDDSASKPLPNR